jgi:hypothetical protein
MLRQGFASADVGAIILGAAGGDRRIKRGKAVED